MTQTTVTPTTNDDGATYEIKLDGVAYADGVIPLAVGRNVITVEVTAEDGNTAQTYTATVTRADSPPPSPPATIELSSDSVEEGTEITVTMSFANLGPDSDSSTTDYVFRADVKDSANGDADGCEGGGMGRDRYMYQVDEDPEVRTGTISAACPPGDYTVETSISSPDKVELASATANFTVNALPPTDATLSGLALSGVDFGAFDPATIVYEVSVAHEVDETTVTPTTHDDGASYVVKLDDTVDEDGTVSCPSAPTPSASR